MPPLSYEVTAVLTVMFTVTIIVIAVAAVTINAVTCHMSRKLFRAMVYMRFSDLTESEKNSIYQSACKRHGFDEVK